MSVRSRRHKDYNILMIAPTSFFADYGCHIRILEEALALQKLGHRVTICTYHSGQDVAGLSIRRTASIPWRQGHEVGSSRHKMAFDVLLSWKSLEVALRDRPDIIHSHLHEGALIGYPVSLVRGAPLLFDFQGSLTSEMVDHRFLDPKGPFYQPVRWLERLIDRLPQAVITNSQHAADLLAHEFGCPRERISVVPDRVNTELFRPSREEGERVKRYLGLPPDRRVIVYLGLLAPYQGTDLLLEAARYLRESREDLHFLIMGYPSVEQYREKARGLGIGDIVTFTGRIPYLEAPAYLSAGEVAVAPKMSATEGHGKLLNYMAKGLPIVAFDTPLNREYLEDLAVYTPLGDAKSFAQGIASLLDNKDWASELGERLRSRAIANYSTDGMGREISAIYDHLLSDRVSL